MLTLSKNLTFSLKILVMLLAIGLVAAPSAMAAEFGVSLDMTDDMSTNGGLQLVRSSAVDSDGNITLTVRFDRAVKGADVTKNLSITTYDGKGVFVALPTGTAAPAGEAAEFTIKVPVPANVTTVTLKIAKGIKSADLFNDDTSGELKQTVHILADDDGTPTVYSIRRVGDPLLKLGESDTSVKVVVTLSEQPREFKKDHISVTEADVDGDPVALDPIAEETTESLSRQVLQVVPSQTPPTLMARALYNTGTGDDLVEGIHDAINNAPPKALTDAITAYNALAATPVLAGLVADPITPDTDSLPLTVASVTSRVVGVHRPWETVSLNPEGTAIQLPASPTFDADDTAATIKAALDAADNKALKRSVTPVVPDPATVPQQTIGQALAVYDLLLADHNLYMAEKALHNAYLAAVKAEQKKDMDAHQEAVDEFYAAQDLPPLQRSTGRDNMLHPFVVTIKPKFANKNSIVVRIKEFEDRTYPTPNKYMPPKLAADYVEGQDQLTIKVDYVKPGAVKTAGIVVHLPHGDAPEIPAGGYFLLVRDAGVSGIVISGAGDENDQTKQTPAQLKYNARTGGSVNLETFLKNGGTIVLTTTTGAAMGDVVISEIMWGSDAANADSWKSQWIELHNTTGSKIVIGEKQWTLTFYGANEAVPTSGYIDRVGTRDETNGIFWAPKGSSGRTDVGATTAANPGGIVGTVALVSMQRASSAGTYADGTMASNWSASALPATNFVAGAEGQRIGTPGAAPPTLPQPTPTPTPEPAPPKTPDATASDINITEIMVDTGNGRLPQWIELTNMSSAAVSLDGWSAVIDNAADADVFGDGAPITVSLDGIELGVGEGIGNGDGEGQSALLVAWSARHSSNLGQDKNDNSISDRIVNLATQLKQTGRYQLLSYNGFRITLVPKQTSPVLASGDDVGNLGMNWDIPMDAEGRSSLIRMQTDHNGMPQAGTSAAGWRLASMTDLIKGPISWYGSDEDAGTPGYDSGGPLPVELSMFYPARDRLTGAVVIKWETQSELNNAGFFIKRSQQRDGKFVVINPQMIAGAGTTSEKQSYTYMDTSAKPNVVYYYQIEDVSLDGQRQTLTLGTRLRGHIGAAGKATTTWGELKAQE